MSMPFGVAPAAIQQMMPNTMRAQATALYLFVINLVGIGLGPTIVAALDGKGLSRSSKPSIFPCWRWAASRFRSQSLLWAAAYQIPIARSLDICKARAIGCKLTFVTMTAVRLLTTAVGALSVSFSAQIVCHDREP